mgnify:CR=1 FL=1
MNRDKIIWTDFVIMHKTLFEGSPGSALPPPLQVANIAANYMYHYCKERMPHQTFQGWEGRTWFDMASSVTKDEHLQLMVTGFGHFRSKRFYSQPLLRLPPQSKPL